MISSTNIYYVQFKHVHNSSYNYNYRFPMNRTHEDTIESQLSLKKPNLDIQEPLQTNLYGHSKPGMYNIYIIIYTVCIS